MKITVITACLNAEDFIGDCLDSVASQTHSDIEHLIIDGGSTDRTLEIVEANDRPGIRLVSEKDDGLYHALNRGLGLASGDVIGFLHADDIFASDLVLATIAETLSDPDVAACYADLEYVRRDDTNRVVRHWQSSPFAPGSFRRGWMPPHPTFYARAAAYDQVGKFDTDLAIGADWEFLLRFFEKHQLPTRYVPQVWTRMRLGGVSNRSLSNIVENNLTTWRVCSEHFGTLPSLLFPVQKAVHRLRQFRR